MPKQCTDADCPPILVVMPTYGAFDYARKALASLFAYSPQPAVTALIVDDGSDDWDPAWVHTAGNAAASIHYSENGGLTKAMNLGLAHAYDMPTPPEYVALVNSDVLFTPGWWCPMVYGLTHGYDVVGPLSNAPGVTSHGVQEVKRWCYRASRSDDQARINAIAGTLRRTYNTRVEPCDVNGFFLLAKTSTWLRFASHPPRHTFPPSIDVMPSGRKNPTPCMTGQEDWLNHQVKKAGGKTGAALGSYVFHYRSVSRGERYAVGNWTRMKKETTL